MKTLIDRLTSHIPRGGGQAVNVGIDYIEDSLKDFGVDLDPAYQRGHVWSQDQQELFLGALITQADRIPSCIIRRIPGRPPNRDHEVLDGKQRITACRAFRAGLVPFNIGGARHYYAELCKIDRSRMKASVNLRWQFVDIYDDAAAIRYYLALNTGGSVHTEAELERVRGLLAGTAPNMPACRACTEGRIDLAHSKTCPVTLAGYPTP